MRKPSQASAASVVELAPQPAYPVFTARAVAKNLGEHLGAFLAANNLNGWAPDEDYPLSDRTIGDQMLKISQMKSLHVKTIRKKAKDLKKFVCASGAPIKHSEALDMFARALGYSNYPVAFMCREESDRIVNAWPSGAALSLRSLDQNIVDLRMNPDLKASLIERIKRNKVRDGVEIPAEAAVNLDETLTVDINEGVSP